MIAAIQDGLSRDNQSRNPDPTARHMLLYVEDRGEVVGGLIGRISRRWLRIDTLWLEESHRGTGLGRDLLERAEALSRADGCHSARLDSYSFQSHEFYRGLGYEEFAKLDGLPNGDVPNGDVLYFLKKALRPDSR